MKKKNKIFIIVIANVAMLIPTVLFTLAIFEYNVNNLGELYVNLGFMSLFYLIICGFANSFMADIL